MNALFPVAPLYPEGFGYMPHFISVAEEQALLNTVKNIHLHTFRFQGYEAKRRVASFGYDWNFEQKKLTKGSVIPEAFSFLMERVAQATGISPQAFAELLVTEYPVGSVINWHRDAPPFDLIAGISLSASATFRLRPYNKAQQNRKAVISLEAERRSLYIMQGTARTEWEHSIAPVKEVRYSITLRTLR